MGEMVCVCQMTEYTWEVKKTPDHYFHLQFRPSRARMMLVGSQWWYTT